MPLWWWNGDFFLFRPRPRSQLPGRNNSTWRDLRLRNELLAFRLRRPMKSNRREARSRLLAFLDQRSRVDEMLDLPSHFSSTQEVELTRCRISPSHLLGPKKSSWRDAGSHLLVFLDPRSWVNEMLDLAFLSSWTQEVELTRCRISPSRLPGPKMSSWRDAGSRLLVFLGPRSRVVKET